MILQVQINMLLFSFFYGFLFSFLINVFNRWLYSDKLYIRVLTTIFFVIGNTVIYFIGMRKINEAIIHPYAILMLIGGYIVEIFVSRVIVNYLKK